MSDKPKFIGGSEEPPKEREQDVASIERGGEHPTFANLDTNRSFIEAGWQGSAQEPVINWPVDKFNEGERHTVAYINQNYYNHEGEAELPAGVEGVEWRRVYELRDGKWEIVE